MDGSEGSRLSIMVRLKRDERTGEVKAASRGAADPSHGPPPPPPPPPPPAAARLPEGTKGLDNRANTFHCFVNVCLQGCLHLRRLRKAIIEAGHRCDGGGREAACLLCEVRYVVESAPRSEASYLKPDRVRAALKVSSPAIEENKMADAVECFTLMVEELARSVAPTCPSDPLLRLLPPSPYIFNASEFLYARAAPQSSTPSFSDLLKVSCRLSLEQMTPKALGYTPQIFAYHVVWRRYRNDASDGTPDLLKEDLRCFCSGLGHQVDLHTVHGIRTKRNRPHPTASLRGFIAYYPGMHYTSFFRLTSGAWAHFDDKRVRVLSSDWGTVVNFVLAGKHMPVMLFYERDERVGDRNNEGNDEDEDWENISSEEEEDDGDEGANRHPVGGGGGGGGCCIA